MSSSWFPPDRGLNSINYFSHSLRVFFCLFVLQIPSLNLWFAGMVVQVSSIYSHDLWNSTSECQVLGHDSPDCSVWPEWPILWTILLIPNFFNVRFMEATVLLGSFQCRRKCCSLLEICDNPVSVPLTTWLSFCSGMHFHIVFLICKVTTNLLCLMAWFLLGHYRV